MKTKENKTNVKDYLKLQELFGYFFRKQGRVDQPGFSLRAMHFVNKFSLVVFLLAVIYLLIKHLL